MESHLTVIHAAPAARSIGVSAEYMVIHQEMLRAQRLDSLCIRTDRASVVTNFVVWQDYP